jgi:hypothetical protein
LLICDCAAQHQLAAGPTSSSFEKTIVDRSPRTFTDPQRLTLRQEITQRIQNRDEQARPAHWSGDPVAKQSLASRGVRVWKFARNKDAPIEFIKYYADNWVEAFKASSGYKMPLLADMVPKPMPLLSDDPTSTPHDKLAVLQTSDEWSPCRTIRGRPGLRPTKSTTTSSSAI